MAATTGLAGFLTRVRHTLADDARTDAELVREYVRSRSDAAFAELVRRFAPMVWGVCRRTVGQEQSAEDAFQAVFLVLARRAGTVRPAAAVGGWLHGVAVHTSMRARAMTDRRQRKHSPLDADHPAPSRSPTLGADELRVLDEEIARLPEKLRAAVALCELDGASRKTAAARLGIAEGTLSSRLATARKQLAARLRSRGVTLGAGGIAALMSGTAVAVPPVAATASEHVTALAEGAIRAMFLSKLKLPAVGVLVVTLLVAVGVTSVSPAAAKDQRPVRRNAPVPAAKPREGVVCVSLTAPGQTARLLILKPDGERVKEIALRDEIAVFSPVLSRDAGRVAVFIAAPGNGVRAKQVGQKGWSLGRIAVYDPDKPGEAVATVEDVISPVFAWAPDGKTLYVSEIDPTADGEPTKEGQAYPWAVSAFDVAAGTKSPLDLPPGHVVSGVTPDGKTLLTGRWSITATGGRAAKPYLVPLATLKPELAADTAAGPRELSPDGKRYVGYKPRNTTDRHPPLDPVLVDLNGRGETALKLEDDTEYILQVKWAPDGKRLLVHRQARLPADAPADPPIPGVPAAAPAGGPVKRLREEVAVRDPDGKNPKVVYELKPGEHVTGIDWR